MAAYFNGTTFGGNAGFEGTAFRGHAEFGIDKFEGHSLTFRDATFIYADSQEEACRWAKNVLERNGNREEAGYHFYREMEAIRKRKGFFCSNSFHLKNDSQSQRAESWSVIRRILWYDVLEYVFIQLIFGYACILNAL